MFCGIIQGTREIKGKVEDSGIYRLKIDLTELTEGLQTGASVSVNGVCLTVGRIQDKMVFFDARQKFRKFHYILYSSNPYLNYYLNILHSF